MAGGERQEEQMASELQIDLVLQPTLHLHNGHSVFSWGEVVPKLQMVDEHNYLLDQLLEGTNHRSNSLLHQQV